MGQDKLEVKNLHNEDELVVVVDEDVDEDVEEEVEEVKEMEEVEEEVVLEKYIDLSKYTGAKELVGFAIFHGTETMGVCVHRKLRC